MNEACLIISGGDYHPLPEELQKGRFACIIACDKGWRHAKRMGLTPDLALGDFDSAPPPKDMPLLQLPSRKDDTDTLLGVKEALRRGFRDIHILCGFGGRLDHSLANLQVGGYGAVKGARVYLYGKDTRVLVSGPDKLRLPCRSGWSLSLFSMGEAVEGLSLKGTSYDGEDLKLTAHFPLGVSNGWIAPQAVVSWEKGILLIMESKLRKGEHIG